ncbi:MAG: hypothetical protein EDQ89_10640 [Acidobacteria bacterium]|nr:MAG: hypothetical protein EDQ89_10640 [Acidobacteriota bacterium]MCL4286999.1 hypothetical protein [Thermoleophilia bacterium]GIK76554.1 MAG: hypothetical protein BroJett022_02440 [Actinomycetes bacterium]
MSASGAKRDRKARAEEQRDAHYPCPACGSPLYGWTAAHDPLDRGRKIVLDRCEECGLVVTRGPDPPDADAEIDELIAPGAGGPVVIVAPNRRSWQAALGGAQWAGLEPGVRRLHVTPESLRQLLARRGLEATEIGTPFRNRAFGLMWQTLVNAFTYRDDFIRNRRAGRLPKPEGGRERFLYGLDWLVSVLVAVPAAILALPLELLATAFARGGVLTVSARPSRR